MEDRVCLLTDGSDAAGHALAVSLAKMDATVVVVARTAAEGAAVRGRIAADSGSARVEVLVGDLGAGDGVEEVAADFLAAHDRLDVLVNNAPTVPFGLTTLLVKHLKPVDALRVVGAGAPEAAVVMNVLFTDTLARRTEGTPVTVNCVRGGRWASARKQAVGALYLATSPMVDGVTGRYFVGMREARSPHPEVSQDSRWHGLFAVAETL